MFLRFNDLSQSCERMNFIKNQMLQREQRYFLEQFFDIAGDESE